MNFRIKILVSVIVITLTTVVLCFTAISTPQKTSNAPVSSNEKKYILKEFNGMLAIYESTQNTPIEILDVNITALPERDIQRIEKGIVADSLNEIYALAEDYE